MTIEFHYLDPNPGGAPIVVLIHGLGGDAETWGYQILALAEAGMRPLAVDLPGFGKTPMGTGLWSIQSTTKQLAEWLGKKVPSRFVIAGHSLGGLIAQQMAFCFPGQVEKLILVSTFSKLRPKSAKSLTYLFGRVVTVLLRGTAVQAELVANHLFPDEEQSDFRELLIKKISAADPRAYKAAMSSLVFYNSQNQLSRLTKPVLVITGDHDGTVPPDAQKAMAESIPNARFVVIPNAGHAVIVDQPGLVNAQILEFLRQAGG